MKKSEALKAIYRELGQVLASTDFCLNWKKEGFVRTINGGWQEIGVAFYAYADRFEFALVLTIRIDDMERIINMFSGSPPQFHSETETAAVKYEYFIPGAARFRVCTAEDIQGAAAVLAPVLRERILPFLDEHQDVASLDHMLNRCTPSVDTSYHPYRGMSAIIVAKMAGNADFERLVAHYANEMIDMPAPAREKFSRLADYLRSCQQTG